MGILKKKIPKKMGCIKNRKIKNSVCLLYLPPLTIANGEKKLKRKTHESEMRRKIKEEKKSLSFLNWV